jgi:hypothetical protein
LSNFSLSNKGNNIYSANNNSEWASFDGSSYTDNGLLHSNANVQTIDATTDSSDNSYFYRFDPTAGMTYSKYNSSQIELWSELIVADNPKEHYLMPAYQRVLIYDANASSLKLRSHQ